MKESRRSFLLALGAGLCAGGSAGALYRTAGAAPGSRQWTADHDPEQRRLLLRPLFLRPLLRPPGALPESDFLAACVRCGQCVAACPFDTLLLAGDGAGEARGTPCVAAERIPCYLCRGHDGLKCIDACPTGALRPVENNYAIRMGTAVIVEEICLAYNSVVCRSCWHACPFPDEAIRFDDRLRPVVDEEFCIGCGLCTHACPTAPTSIPIRPHGCVGEDPA